MDQIIKDKPKKVTFGETDRTKKDDDLTPVQLRNIERMRIFIDFI